MSVTRDLSLTYCGLRIRLQLPTRALHEKFGAVLGPLLSVRHAQADLETVVARKSRFLKDHARWFAGMEKVGRRVFRRPGAIYVEKFVDFPGISFLFQRQRRKLKTTLLVGADFPAMCRDDKNVFQKLLPFLCYYPAFWLLAQRRRIFPLHGGGLRYKGRGVILAGLQGVGKSTLILNMLRESGGRLLSDNVYLHDRRRVYACPETIRLDDASVRLIGGAKGILKPTRFRSDLDRRMYVVEKERFIPHFRPDIMIIPTFSARTRIAPLATRRAAQMMHDFNELALELRAYHQFVAPLSFLGGAKDRYLDHRKVLMELLERLRIYELNIKPDGRIDRVLSLIDETLGV